MQDISIIKDRIMNFRIKELSYILLGLLPAFILMNKYPYLAISVIIVLLIIGIYYFIKDKEISMQHLRAGILLALLAFYLLFSYFISGQPFINLFNYGFLRYDGNFFFSYAPFVILAIPFLNYRKGTEVYFRFLFIAFTFFSVLGILEYMIGVSSFMVRVDDIYVGPMFVALNNSHNATGSVFSIAAIFAFAFFLESGKKDKVAYGFIFILISIALIITKSRGSMLAFAIGVFFLLLFGSGSFLKFLRNIFILTALGVSFVFITGTYLRITQIFHIYDLSALARISLWDKAIILFKQSPIAGIGFARYNDVPWNFDKLPLTGNPGVFSLYTAGNFIFNDSNAHSSYLHFLAETGVIGLVLALLFWIFCLVVIFRAYRSAEDIFSRKVYLAIVGGIITLFILSVTENYMTAPTVMTCLSMATTLAVGLSGRKKAEKSEL